MDWLSKILLKNYNPDEKEVYMTAGFVMVVILCIIFTTSATIIYTVFLHGLNSRVVFTQLFGFTIFLTAFILLVKGNWVYAVHAVFIAGFTTLWVIMFTGSGQSVIMKTDTIVFVVGLLAALPIAAKSRKSILSYFFLNVIVFLIFNYHLKNVLTLTLSEHLEYIADNLAVMAVVCLASFNIFNLRQKVFHSLRQELECRKKIEEELLESRHQLSVHLNNTPVGAISWDTGFHVMDWNPSAETIFGYSRQEAIGKHASELILPEDVKKMVNDIFQNVLAGREGGERSVNENLTKNGKRILCDWYNTIIRRLDGTIVGVASLVNDITERRKTQEMMIQSEKMMSVGGLAAGMAHEINNPLSGIMQNAQLIYSRLVKGLPANDKAAQEFGTTMDVIHGFMEKRGILLQLQTISHAARRVAQIIENMLSFSKKSDRNRKETDLEELIGNTLELVKNDSGFITGCKMKPIEIVKEFGLDLPKIYCEKSKIQQVLFNLIKNASESMSSKKYENENPKIILRLKKDQTKVHIEVEDNGSGMDAEISKHVFEQFFTTKGADKGTGLGLSISYFIVVDDHGGQLEVDSTPGIGTRFIIKLPFRF